MRPAASKTRLLAVSSVVIMALGGCGKRNPVRNMYNGTAPMKAELITVGTVRRIERKPQSSIEQSPSIVAPDRIASIETTEILRGAGKIGRVRLSFEASRADPLVEKSKYVFFWDARNRCTHYYAVEGDVFIRDGARVPLDELRR